MTAHIQQLAASVFAPLDGLGRPRGADMAAAARWGTAIEMLANLAYTSSLVYPTRTLLQTNSSAAAYTPALVVGDAIAGRDGLYFRNAAVVGGWQQVTDFVPGAQFVNAADVGAGTANAIEATTSLALSLVAGQLIRVDPFEPNSGTPVTIRFNGTGTTYTIKTASGNNVPAGGLTGPFLGTISGSQFRLLSDIASAAVLASIEDIHVDFRSSFLGSYATDPATDIFGAAPSEGALYWNSTSNLFKYFDGAAWQTIPYATVADGGVTTAKLADAAVTMAKILGGAVSTLGVPRVPSVLQDNNTSVDQGNFIPHLQHNFYWRANFGWWFSGYNDPRFYAGDSSYGFQSKTTTVLGTNRAVITGGPYNASNTTVVLVTPPAQFIAGATVSFILDQLNPDGSNQVHEALITGMIGAGNATVQFSPGLPSGKSITVGHPDAPQQWRACASRVTSTTATVSSGNTLQTISKCGIVSAGEPLRVQYDDGTWLVTTTDTGWTNTTIKTVDAITKTISAGRIVHVGGQDVDPNWSLDRGGMPGAAGDIGVNFQFTHRTKQNGSFFCKREVVYIEDADLAGGTAQARTEIQVQLPGATTAQWSTTFSWRKGLVGQGLTADSGRGSINARGLRIMNGEDLVFQESLLASMAYGTVNAGAFVDQTATITDVAVGDELTYTLPSAFINNGIDWFIWRGATDTVYLRAYNRTGSNIVLGTANVRIVARRYA